MRRKSKFRKDFIDLTRDDRTPEEIEKYHEHLDRMMELRLIGVFDDSASYEKNYDRSVAADYIERDEPIPDDLMKRILQYKREDEEMFRRDGLI